MLFFRVISLLLFFSISIVFSQNPYPTWTHTATIQLNTTPTGANIPGTASESNIPILIKLGSGYFDFTQANADGSDIRFSSSTGTILPYEIHSWDSQTGNALIWVLVDQISGNALSTINIHWGNNTATSESSGTTVFGTDYLAVWHLDEDGNTDVDGYKDASAGQKHGTGKSMTSLSDVVGIVGRAQNFDGKEDWIDLPVLGPQAVPNVTYQWWNLLHSKIQGSGRYGAILRASRRGNGKPELEWSPTYGMRCPFRGNPAMNPQFRMGDVAVPGEWTHFALTFDSAANTAKFYKNGVLDKEHVYDGGFSLNFNADHALAAWSEAYGDDDDRDFHDAIYDEFQLAAKTRSADWIKISYENTRRDGSLAGLPKVAGCSPNFGIPLDTVNGVENSMVVVSGNAQCADQLHWFELKGNSEVPMTGNMPLAFDVNRISADSTISLIVKALYGAQWQMDTVIVKITKSLPDPAFTLTTPLPAGQKWTGRDTIEIIPNISNAAAILALPAPYNAINYNWSFVGAPAARSMTDSSIMLRYGYSQSVTVRLCLDNKGTPLCNDLLIETTVPALTNVVGPGPVQIFILAGQSNMEGHGALYPAPGASDQSNSLEYLVLNTDTPSDFDYLFGSSGSGWSDRKDVWIKYDGDAGNLKAGFGVNLDQSIGPELGFGNVVGNGLNEQIVLLKVCRGGRALATNFRPPSAGVYSVPQAEGDTGYWYEQVISQTTDMLNNIGNYFPGYSNQGVRIAGMGWHQGWNDWVDDARIAEYPTNMAHFIRDVRTDLNVPNMPFVIAESGMACFDGSTKGNTFCGNQVAPAALPEFSGNVAGVATRQFYYGGATGPGYHWNLHSKSYMEMGKSMGNAMLQLLANDTSVVSSQPDKIPVKQGFQMIKHDGNIYLTFPQTGDYQLVLQNILGEQIYNKRVTNQSNFIFSTSKLESGVYYLQVKGREVNFRKRFLEL